MKVQDLCLRDLRVEFILLSRTQKFFCEILGLYIRAAGDQELWDVTPYRLVTVTDFHLQSEAFLKSSGVLRQRFLSSLAKTASVYQST